MAANEDRPLEGACTCGAVRYLMKSKPMFVHCCHCRWCQRETGASFALNALIEADRVVLLKGEPEVVAGTPLIVPVALSMTRLAGRPEALQVFEPLPPLAASVIE